MSIEEIIADLEKQHMEAQRMIDEHSLLTDEHGYKELEDGIQKGKEIIALLKTHPAAQTKENYKVIRGKIEGEEKYCRIPVRSRLAEQMVEDSTTELNAEKILAMPHDKAVKTIDNIMMDWEYWMKRAGELFVLYHGLVDTEEV